jgi:DNA helicase-2/ATP-dependent DNA helicase PcrA
MDSLHPDGHSLLPAELVRQVITYLNPYFTHTYDNFDERSEDLAQITRNLGTEENLEEFLASVALLSEVDSPTTPDDDTVTLSTIHQAKGLEWKIVFIIFLGEGQFPHKRVIESGSTADIEEETRLFYVAVTRAQDQLYLSFPRYNGRSYDAQFSPPSRFLTTLPQELIQLWSD